MRTFATPNVVVSRCIEFDRCRYNHDIIASPIVRELKDHVRFFPVCPEMAIGLGVPRDPIRLIARGGATRLVQPATGRDVTEEMEAFAEEYLQSLHGIDGFILKSRSPSCGVRDVRIYGGSHVPAAADRNSGLFAREVRKRCSHLAIEDEGRLRNYRIREHFLTKLFTLAELREFGTERSSARLREFHSDHALLLRAYNPEEEHALERIAGDATIPFDTAYREYTKHMYRALSHPPDLEAYVQVMTGVMQSFSEKLSKDERGLFSDAIRKYRAGNTSRCPAITILKAWVARFGEPVCQRQSLFAPYPDALMEVDEERSDRGRDLWQEAS
ncbi:hypothetical protein ABH15_05685 [Methanoculleus taiwanensis]|uniref:DUF1722 domain-containing protein n=1 Tax=Methanoculleus taiwanensis TaxID=1550565 RepID=A0A498GZC2_9EURY|nr:DUF523 and DUF1722 domain-containing protein [Methanoculleus taiwanensis]RXE55728.1 hypothetical protein ABH15_05685 [Methanoculleus taiwanensis]